MTKGNGAPRKKRGRPPLPPKKGKRYPLSLRTTEELKERLRGASRLSGRSIAQEVEFRLEQTFRDADNVDAPLKLAYGPRNAGVLMTIGRALNYADMMSELYRERSWLDDPGAFDGIVDAVIEILRVLRPPGETACKADDLNGRSEAVAGMVLHGLAEQNRHSEDWAARVRELVGPVVIDRLPYDVVRRPSKEEISRVLASRGEKKSR